MHFPFATFSASLKVPGYTMSHYTFKLAHIRVVQNSYKKKEQKITYEFRELLIYSFE